MMLKEHIIESYGRASSLAAHKGQLPEPGKFTQLVDQVAQVPKLLQGDPMCQAIFLDSRASRVLSEERRSMFDDEVWEWIVDHTNGDFDHLLLATTVPYLLSPGFHHLEAWNERLCDGAWGRVLERPSERLRRAVDFDHWAAFQFSFRPRK